MRNESDSGMLVVGLFLGLLIGAVVTLFYAPFDARTLRASTEKEIEQLRNQTDRVSASLSDGRSAVLERRLRAGSAGSSGS
ncbi:MAG: YtxH domain-containing protein [Chloroflexi bacterium]|nr:YtxH domain-containing protein [Chloroflexota bacterium]